MRHFLLAGATSALLCGPAFAGAPTAQTMLNIPPISITVQTAIAVTAGAQVNTQVHAGPITIANSVATKAGLLQRTSQSVSVTGNGGYYVP
jgi:hypothetical protein